MDPLADALVDRHEAVHALLEEELWLTLEALVERRLMDAQRSFRRFGRVIDKHMRFEDREVLPRYEPIAPKDGPGRLDHVKGDHVILLRHLEEGRTLIDALSQDEATPPLRDVLRDLPLFYRLLNVLEHHTKREGHVYRLLAARGLADDALRCGLEECLVDDDETV